MGVLIEDKEFDGTQCGEYDPDTRTAYIESQKLAVGSIVEQ